MSRLFMARRSPSTKVSVPDAPPSESTIENQADDSFTSDTSKPKKKKKAKDKPFTQIVLLHCDIIKDEFWTTRPYLLTE